MPCHKFTLRTMLHEENSLTNCNATMTNEKHFKLQRGCHTFATFFATCNAYNNKQDAYNHKQDAYNNKQDAYNNNKISRERKMSSDWPILTKLRCKLLMLCASNCLATLRKVEGRSTFLATRNATIAVSKWSVTREFFRATHNATIAVSKWGATREFFLATCNLLRYKLQEKLLRVT